MYLLKSWVCSQFVSSLRRLNLLIRGNSSYRSFWIKILTSQILNYVFNNESSLYLNAHLNDIHVVGVVVFKYFFVFVRPSFSSRSRLIIQNKAFCQGQKVINGRVSLMNLKSQVYKLNLKFLSFSCQKLWQK